jgi:phosphoglycerate dehydrogenase-like enzyme
VGRAVLDLLRGYDARLLLHDPYLRAEQARSLGADLVDLDRLCPDSDIVSLHAPELPETHHLLDARRLGLLHDGAIVVNTARGGLLDHAALAAQCAAGGSTRYSTSPIRGRCRRSIHCGPCRTCF